LYTSAIAHGPSDDADIVRHAGNATTTIVVLRIRWGQRGGHYARIDILEMGRDIRKLVYTGRGDGLVRDCFCGRLAPLEFKHGAILSQILFRGPLVLRLRIDRSVRIVRIAAACQSWITLHARVIN
jgi:hypothetical protein